MKPFSSLLLPITIAAAFPANAQDAEFVSSTEVSEPQQLPEDEAPATTDDDLQVQWNIVNVITDTSPLDVKIERWFNDEEYKEAVNELFEETIEDSDMLSRSVDPDVFLTFIESFTNPEITAEMLAAHPELDELDTEEARLDQNYSFILQCRQDAPEIQNIYLRYQHVRGCARNAMNAPVVEPEIIYEGIAGVHEMPFAAPYSFDEKLRAFQAEDEYYQKFQGAVIAETEFLEENGYTEELGNREAMMLTDALLSHGQNANDMTILNEGSNPQFLLRKVGSRYIDDNLQLAFECRDELLPTQTPEEIMARQTLLNNIITCTQSRSSEADQEIADQLSEAEITPVSLAFKQQAYEAGTRNSRFSPYYRDVRSSLESSPVLTEDTRQVNAIVLWHAMLNPSVQWDDLKTLVNNDDPNDLEFAWNANAPEPDRNLKYMFECREDLLPANTSETDMTQRRDVFNAISQCWVEKNTPHAEEVNAARAQADAERSERIQSAFEAFAKIVGGLFALYVIGYIGVRGYRYQQNRPKKKKKLDW